jgi:hypothetical protein
MNEFAPGFIDNEAHELNMPVISSTLRALSTVFEEWIKDSPLQVNPILEHLLEQLEYVQDG